MEILIEATFRLKQVITFDAGITGRDIRSIEVYGQNVHTELRDGTVLHARLAPADKEPISSYYTILPKTRKKEEVVPPPEKKTKKPVKRKTSAPKEEAPVTTFPVDLSDTSHQDDHAFVEAFD